MSLLPLSVLQNVSKSKSKWIVDLTLKMYVKVDLKLSVFLKPIHAIWLMGGSIVYHSKREIKMT